MQKTMYELACEAVKESFKEGRGSGYVTTYLNDLARSGDLTWDQVGLIWMDVLDEKL